MEKAVLLAKFKCENVCSFLDEKEKNEYMIITCVNDEKRELNIKENSLLIDLLENEVFLNYTDEFNKEVINCDFKKIKELR